MSEPDKYIDRLIALVKEVTESNAAQTQSIEALENKVTEEIHQIEGSIVEAVSTLADRVAALEEKKCCVLATEDFKSVKENIKKLLTEETYDILTLVKSTKKFVSFVSILFIILSSVLVLVGIYALLHGFFKGT